MFDKLKQIIELFKILYIKIAIMCKSDCVIGRDNPPKSPKNPPTPSNDDNHVDERRGVSTSII
jgi:hypothetical protein